MGSFWGSSSKDKIKNGAIFGALIGVTAGFGTQIIEVVNGLLPESWMFLGTVWSPIFYLVIAGALTGMIVDKY